METYIFDWAQRILTQESYSPIIWAVLAGNFWNKLRHDIPDCKEDKTKIGHSIYNAIGGVVTTGMVGLTCEKGLEKLLLLLY